MLKPQAMGQTQPTELSSGLGIWEFGSAGAAAAVITSPLLPDFQTYGEPSRPDNVTVHARSGM